MAQENAGAVETFHALYWRAMSGLDLLRLRAWEAHGLTLPQLKILFHLRRRPGATTGDLARHLGVTMPTASSQVQKLVERGLVQRGRDANDRRILPLTLTEEGSALLGMTRAVSLQFAEHVAARLGGDLPAVIEGLGRLAEAVEAAAVPLERERSFAGPRAQGSGR